MCCLIIVCFEISSGINEQANESYPAIITDGIKKYEYLQRLHEILENVECVCFNRVLQYIV